MRGLCGCVGRLVLLRDLLELVVWENHGLFQEVEPFLRTLPGPAADRALRELARLITELRAAGLGHHLARASDLRRAVIAAVDAFTSKP